MYTHVCCVLLVDYSYYMYAHVCVYIYIYMHCTTDMQMITVVLSNRNEARLAARRRALMLPGGLAHVALSVDDMFINDDR